MRPLLIIFLFVMISSCEKTVNISLPYEANKLVLNLLMNKDSIMMARVSLSGRLNEYQTPSQMYTETVNLYEN